MNILKKSAGVAVGMGMLLGAALPAFAAANLTFLTVDGGTNATVSEGSTVEAKVTFDITSSTDVESMSWELVGSGLPKTCVDTVDRIADGTFTASFDVDTSGASEGTWDVRITAYGDDGADVSNLCENTDQLDTQLFTDRITVTDDEDDNQSNTGGSSFIPAWFTAWWNSNKPATAPATTTPAISAACANIASKMFGTQMGVYNDANVRLQGYLLGEGASIPALKAGASFGFYGPQTMAAVSWFNAVNNCR